MVRIERVDPLECAEQASRLIQAAWNPPCLNYTPEYLRWQFGFSGKQLQPVTLAAFDDNGDMIGLTWRRDALINRMDI